MSLPGPILPPNPPTGSKDGEPYTPNYFTRGNPGLAIQGGYRNPYVLAVIILTLLLLLATYFFLIGP